MKKAIDTVKKNEMGFLMASKVYGIRQATFRRDSLEQNNTLAPRTRVSDR